MQRDLRYTLWNVHYTWFNGRCTEESFPEGSSDKLLRLIYYRREFDGNISTCTLIIYFCQHNLNDFYVAVRRYAVKQKMRFSGEYESIDLLYVRIQNFNSGLTRAIYVELCSFSFHWRAHLHRQQKAHKHDYSDDNSQLYYIEKTLTISLSLGADMPARVRPSPSIK